MGKNGNSIVGRLAIASESMKVYLRVLKNGNKNRYDTYSVKDVPFIVSVISTHTPFQSVRLTPLPTTFIGIAMNLMITHN